jgi:hypothetical protein
MQASKRDHNVYILGAGFSKDAGLPLMQEFMHKIKDKYEDPDTQIEDHLHKDFDLVIDYRNKLRACRDYINADLENIETLFSLISMDCLSDRSEADLTHRAIRRVIADIVGPQNTKIANGKFFIEKSSLDDRKLSKLKMAHISNHPVAAEGDKYVLDEYSFFVALLGKLITKKQSHKDTVLTFNYDTILEDRASLLGMDIDYGFEKKASDNESIKLLKLHGSINWQQDIHSDRPILAGHIDGKYDPVILPPTWEKTPQSWLQNIWGSALGAISDATNIIIIGYSMPETDSYFKHLITAGLAKNRGINKIIVVDKSNYATDESPLNARYKELFGPLVSYGKYFYSPSGLKEFLYYLTSSRSEYFVNREVMPFSRS